jgi:hypothetical protein
MGLVGGLFAVLFKNMSHGECLVWNFNQCVKQKNLLLMDQTLLDSSHASTVYQAIKNDQEKCNML